MSTTGETIQKVKHSNIKWASPDDPIYSLGWIVQPRNLKPSSVNTPGTSSQSEKPKSPERIALDNFVKNILPQEVKDQMS